MMAPISSPLISSYLLSSHLLSSQGGGKKKKTVSRAFGDSLFALMAKLRATEHHYIRCLKPNQVP
jgi:myosin heavy subunit